MKRRKFRTIVSVDKPTGTTLRILADILEWVARELRRLAG